MSAAALSFHLSPCIAGRVCFFGVLLPCLFLFVSVSTGVFLHFVFPSIPSFVSPHGCVVFGFVWVCLLSLSISQVCCPFSPLSAFVFCLLLPPACPLTFDCILSAGPEDSAVLFLQQTMASPVSIYCCCRVGVGKWVVIWWVVIYERVSTPSFQEPFAAHAETNRLEPSENTHRAKASSLDVQKHFLASGTRTRASELELEQGHTWTVQACMVCQDLCPRSRINYRDCDDEKCWSGIVTQSSVQCKDVSQLNWAGTKLHLPGLSNLICQILLSTCSSKMFESYTRCERKCLSVL